MDKTVNYQFSMIIGAMKCGTTSLYDYLIKHPAICPCIVKEPEFFSENQGHGISRNSYEELWTPNPETHKILLEASTGYTKYPTETNVPKRIYEYGINPKFIYLVRNPFDRIISQYNYIRTNPGFNDHISLLDEHFLYLSKYYLQIQQFTNYFPDINQYLIMDSSELFTSPEKAVKKVLTFLGISVQDYPLSQFETQNKSVKLSDIEIFLHKKGLIKISKLVPKEINIFIKKYLRYFSPESSKKSFSQDEYLKVYEFLAEDMKFLNKEFNINVEAWGFKN